MIWSIGIDKRSVSDASKKMERSSKKQSKEEKKSGGGGGAAVGGFLGALLGSLLTSVQTLLEPLQAIASLLIAALFPIFKPFLILFIRVGLLLYKWLSNLTSGSSTEGVQNQSLNTSGQFDFSELNGKLEDSLLGQLSEVFVGLQNTFYNLLNGILTGLVNGIATSVLSIVSSIDQFLGTNFYDSVKTIFEGVINIFTGLFKVIAGLLQFDMDSVIEGLKQFFGGLLQIFEGIFGILWNNLKLAWESLKDLGSWMISGIQSVLRKSFSALKSLGEWIRSKVKSFFRIGGSNNDKNVNDAIITPNGDIIRTNPADYLIATKNPASLGGFGGGSKSINVNISGGLITEDVARDIGKIILREVNNGGGY